MSWIVMVRYAGDEMYQPYSCKHHEQWADAVKESLWVSNHENFISNITVEQVKEGEDEE